MRFPSVSQRRGCSLCGELRRCREIRHVGILITLLPIHRHLSLFSTVFVWDDTVNGIDAGVRKGFVSSWRALKCAIHAFVLGCNFGFFEVF